MPMGHTEKATINERRPLTELQITYLDRLVAGPIIDDSQNTSQKNVMRALAARELIERYWGINRVRFVWRLTPAGWDAVQKLNPNG